LGATGDTSLIAAMTQTQAALKKIFNQLRVRPTTELLDVVSSLIRSSKPLSGCQRRGR